MLRFMLLCFDLLVVCSSVVNAACYTCGSTTYIRNQWPNNFDAEFSIPITNSVSEGWTLELQFSKPVTNLQIWRADIKSTKSNSSLYILKNKHWNRNLSPGRNLVMSFLGQFNGPSPSFTVRLLGQADCGQCLDGAVIPTTPRPLVATPLGCRTCCSSAEVTHEWPGNFDGEFRVLVEYEVTSGWVAELVFSDPVFNLQVYDAQITDILQGGKIYRLTNKHYNADLAEGIEHIQRFQASAAVTPSFTVHMVGQPECCQGDSAVSCHPSTTLPPPTSEPDATSPTTAASTLQCPLTNIVDEWPGNFKGEIVIPIRNEVSGGWLVELKFSEPVLNLQVYRANVLSILDGGKTYLIKNKDYNADQLVGAVLREQFQASASNTPSFTARMIGQPDCSITPTPTGATEVSTTISKAHTTETRIEPSTYRSTVPPTEPPTEPRTIQPVSEQTTFPVSEPSTPALPTTAKATTTGVPLTPSSAPYDYAEVIHKSILFYEAQRSGPLPANNRIPWRADSTVNDRGLNGEDLTGGWFDAGDHVKFGFPMASTVTVLAWGLVEYRDAYIGSGELVNMLDCIKWATDYFLKCHTGMYEFYAQVGDGHLDHAYWGRPEDMTINRPAFKITAANPGTEIAGETAAALAASSIAFRETDPAYADELLQHARELYDFANRWRGKYTDAIPNAASFYDSHSGYGDELAWSAAWLARATGDSSYVTAATAHYDTFNIGSGTPWAFSWDDKKAGVMMLMYQLTGASRYQTAITDFLDSWQPGNIHYTPKGLAWRDQWGTNRYAANTAFLALVAAREGIDATKYSDFAKQQINYMLGDAGRSYVVGFGNNPPHSPHHRASSCPDMPAPCDWGNLDGSDPNPQVLEGALVGGPDQNDGFVNNRRDFVQNEVATDYNAGFQSAVAGLKSLVINGLY
ncbi:uncharacterized protein LOC110982761 [Acanthaster planci]|uniref:cellulase n=1 Tax=Acanthaster planci TaxID=133434 RepID=A0A8B7YUW6_ACAPL|nr:uncharacterized protein LOC110982761 [Acanthaster planci]